ncbi:sodium/calcium transporter [Talaromyces proteolyticus]|uniref:Sodium/calcium transporter n=1 Tax=Talaromyces proteolyticus TaxID=1131652 RepID=A0AAD4PYY8_9EURO|nr:sodium/calcium transporter [Talaromyces proteolyticus]KAH8695217.1 sodium/calcium transporter [Talaromyces proteolyticus]
MDWDCLSFNAATFIAGVIVLDLGADKFIDHTVVVGRRLGIPQTLIALLTAGAEYEELAVVVAAVLQHQTPLAIGNVMGSTISNILGAFSLGLLFHSGSIDFDWSAKLYTVVQFLITTVFVALAYFGKLNKTTGVILIVLFIVYLITIAYAIYRGVIDPPSQWDSDSDSDNENDDEIEDSEHARPAASETSPLLNGEHSGNLHERTNTFRSLFYHIYQLLIGFLLLSISGFILSHSANKIAEYFNLSGTVIGITILSFATTLPEKFVAVISGSRGHSGIMVASTAGSNIFLLTLCMGIVAVTGIPEDSTSAFTLFELAITWLSSALLLLIVALGLGHLAGITLLAVYITFLVLEFTVYRR